MHGEHLVVQISVEYFAFGSCQLQTNQHCFKTTHDEKEHRRSSVHEAQFFVIHGEEP